MNQLKVVKSFSFEMLNGEIYELQKEQNIYLIKSNYLGELPVNIYFLGANPSNNHFGTLADQYTIPFSNLEIAFENTSNNENIELKTTRNFEIIFSLPNAYYSDNGNVFNESEIYFKFFPFKFSNLFHKKIKLNINDEIKNNNQDFPIYIIKCDFVKINYLK
jgi:hypothetical protein